MIKKKGPIQSKQEQESQSLINQSTAREAYIDRLKRIIKGEEVEVEPVEHLDPNE